MMSMITGPVARIVLRYLAGALVSAGSLPGDIASQMAVDPDILLMVGLALTAAVEGLYALAKRLGWDT